jgi:hypothetical protein
MFSTSPMGNADFQSTGWKILATSLLKLKKKRWLAGCEIDGWPWRLADNLCNRRDRDGR